MGSAMKKMCGFVLFWIAAGMTIMMFVNSCVFNVFNKNKLEYQERCNLQPDYILSYFGL